MKKFFEFLWALGNYGCVPCPEPEPDPAPSVLNDPKPPADDPADPPPSIWGETPPEFPEGIEDDIKEAPSLKSFVQEGKFNYANLMKSYVHNQKMVGKKGIMLPTEHSSKSEIDEFYSKLGFVPDKEKYEVKKEDDSKLGDDFVTALKDFAHSQHLPVKTAGAMVKFFEEQNVLGMETSKAKTEQSVEDGLKKLEVVWGHAFDSRLAGAQTFLIDNASDEFRDYLKETGLATEPRIIEFFGELQHKLTKEDEVDDVGNPKGVLAPVEAEAKIAELTNHPAYYDAKHSEHKFIVAEVQRLYKVKHNEKD